VKTVEVLWIDFGLPGLVYKEVVEEGLYGLYQLADKFVTQLHVDNRNNRETGTAEFTRNKNFDSADIPKLSLLLSSDNRSIVESQLVVFYYMEQLTFPAVLNKSKWRGIITRIPLEFQRLLLCSISPFLLGGFILLFEVLNRQLYGACYVSLIVTFIFAYSIYLVQLSQKSQIVNKYQALDYKVACIEPKSSSSPAVVEVNQEDVADAHSVSSSFYSYFTLSSEQSSQQIGLKDSSELTGLEDTEDSIGLEYLSEQTGLLSKNDNNSVRGKSKQEVESVCIDINNHEMDSFDNFSLSDSDSIGAESKKSEKVETSSSEQLHSFFENDFDF
jgi:hypothetical protein